MGVAYKPRDTHLDRFVAIPVLPAEKVPDPESKRLSIQEANQAGRRSSGKPIPPRF